MKTINVLDSQASSVHLETIDEMDVVKSALSVMVCLGHHVSHLDDGNNRACPDIHRNDTLKLPASIIAPHFDSEVVMNNQLRPVDDLSLL